MQSLVESGSKDFSDERTVTNLRRHVTRCSLALRGFILSNREAKVAQFQRAPEILHEKVLRLYIAVYDGFQIELMTIESCEETNLARFVHVRERFCCLQQPRNEMICFVSVKGFKC